MKKTVKIALSCIIAFSLLMAGYAVVLVREYGVQRERCFYIAQNEIENIITTIDSVMARTYTLKAMVADHDGSTDFFDEIAPSIYDAVREETGVSLKNLLLAPEGKVQKIYPFEGNESLLGFNYMDTSKPGNAEALEAYVHGKMVLTNPFNLVQGGVGIAGRAPVNVVVNGQDTLWGIISVTIDYDQFIESANLANVHKMGFDYQLSVVESDGSRRLLESTENLADNPVTTSFDVHNLTWELSIAPHGGWFDLMTILPGFILIIIATILVGIVVNTMSKLQVSNSKLQELSYRDGLTGAYSRTYVNTVLVDMQNNRWNNPKSKYSLLIIDVDNFKHFNDSFGHDVGDRVIVRVAQALMQNTKEHCGDAVVRFGGDEFVVLLNDVTKERLTLIANAIIDDIRRISFSDVPGLSVTISGGGAYYEEVEDKSYRGLNLAADIKLYQAKESGKDQIVI